MSGKFVIRKSGDQYTFVLKAGNGEIIATASAKNGIESVKENAAKAPIEDETRD